MRKFYLLFALLISFSSAAWADFDQRWTGTPSPWSNTEATNVPEGVTNVKTSEDGTVYSSSLSVVRNDGDSRNVLVGFNQTSGNHALQILGVDLVNESDEVVVSSYSRQTTGDSGLGKYTLNMTGVAAGNYTLRYFVCVGTSESITNTNGHIGVKGLDAAAETGLTNYKAITALSELSNSKVYVLKSGRSISENTNHYLLYHTDATGNLSSTYGSGHSMEYSDATPNFQFALYSANGAYYMYNIAAGKYVGSDTRNNAAIPLMNIPRNALSIKASNNGIYNWVLSVNNFTGALNVADTRGCHGLVNWNGGAGNLDDKGNIYEIIEVGDLDPDIQTTLATQTAWIPQYTTIYNAAASASNTNVGAMTATAGAAVNNTCINFYLSPSQETYDAMVASYNENASKLVTLAAGEIFKIKCIEDSRGYLAYSTVGGKGSATNAWLAQTGNANHPSLTDEGAYTDFAFIEILGKKYIYNTQNKQLLLKGTPVTFAESGSYVEFIEESTAQFNIKFDGESKYLSFSPGYGANNPVRTENSKDNGCRFFLVKQGENVADDVVNEVAERFRPQCLSGLQTKIAKGRLRGTGVSQYAYNGTGDVTSTINDAEAILNNETATAVQLIDAIADLDAILADFSLNMPKVGKLYRLRGYASKNYMAPSAATPTADTKMNMNRDMDLPGTIFMLCAGDQVNGETGYKLLNYFTGYYTKNTHNLGAMASAANSMTIKEATSGNPGCYMLKTNYTGSQWVFDNNTVVDRNGSYAAGNCDWTMEEVTWLPIPVSNTYGIGTFYSPVDIAISDAWYAKDSRLKFYIGSIEEDYLVLTKLEDNIPAETPVVIEYQEHSGYKNGCAYMAIATSAEAVTAKNDLRGTLETINKPSGRIYTLQPATQDATELTFCVYNGTTLAGGKAYLPAASAVKGIRYNTGESTGIEAITTEKASKEIFDLSGRRVQNPTSGLYIINGQKVYVK